MAWVNIFDNEACSIGYSDSYIDSVRNQNFTWGFPNSYRQSTGPQEGTYYTIAKASRTVFYIPSYIEGVQSNASYNFISEDDGSLTPVVNISSTHGYDYSADAVQIIPSQGINGRRFRARIRNAVAGIPFSYDYTQAYIGYPRAAGELSYPYPVNEAVELTLSSDSVYSSDWLEFTVVTEDTELPFPALEDLPNLRWLYNYIYSNLNDSTSQYTASMEWQVWVDDPSPDQTVKLTASSLVYELDKGWSFDGYYIPHFIELNWYFGEVPVNYHGIQKVRIHGLAKGWTKLQMQMAGMQTEYDSDYMSPQYIDLPNSITYVMEDFSSITNYADYSVRGLSMQMKFEGRNEDVTKPEPSHVIQVLVTQSTPNTTGFRAN